MTRRQFRRAIAGAIAIIPALGEMTGGQPGDVSVERLGEAHQNAVLVDVERHRKPDRGSAVANALEAAVIRSVSAPTSHARNIELAILGVELAAMCPG